MIFTWDEAKNKLNKKKHKVSFEEAIHFLVKILILPT